MNVDESRTKKNEKSSFFLRKEDKIVRETSKMLDIVNAESDNILMIKTYFMKKDFKEECRIKIKVQKEACLTLFFFRV